MFDAKEVFDKIYFRRKEEEPDWLEIIIVGRDSIIKYNDLSFFFIDKEIKIYNDLYKEIVMPKLEIREIKRHKITGEKFVIFSNGYILKIFMTDAPDLKIYENLQLLKKENDNENYEMALLEINESEDILPTLVSVCNSCRINHSNNPC